MTASHLRHYNNAPFDGLCSSAEIIAAIDEIGSGAVYEEGSEAYRIWAEPTSSEQSEVLRRAWEYADADETELFWGQEKIVRE